MKKFWEIFQQQDGGACVLQTSIALSIVVFWLVWAYVSFLNHQVADAPAGVVTLIGAGYAAKVWKDKIDREPPPPPAPTAA